MGKKHIALKLNLASNIKMKQDCDLENKKYFPIYEFIHLQCGPKSVCIALYQKRPKALILKRR